MVVFEDGQVGTTQETVGDMSAWTGGVLTNGGVTFGVTATKPHHGSNCFQLDNLNDDADYGLAIVNINNGPTVYERVYAWFTADVANGTYIDQLMTLYQNGIDIIDVRLNRSAGGDYTWSLYIQGAVQASGVVTVTLNAWHVLKMKVFIDGANGEALLYVDDTLMVNATGLAFGSANNITQGRIGAVAVGAVAVGTIYMDCAVIDTADIPDEVVAPALGTFLTCLAK